MIVRAIDPALVDAGERIRALDPVWVILLADEIAQDGQIEPIRVVERAGRFLLLHGARRLAAILQIGGTIEAVVEPEAALADAAFVRLGEIKGHLMRADLTVLDRARTVAAWRDLYLSAQNLPKRGRGAARKNILQRRKISGAANDDAPDVFVASLTEAARQALRITKDTLYRYLKIAAIDPAQARRLAGHGVADARDQLLLLAEQMPERQVAIVNLLLADRALTVAGAIERLDGAPSAPVLSVPERLYQRFSRLQPQDQDAFFDLNAEAIERWAAARGSKTSRRSVA